VENRNFTNSKQTVFSCLVAAFLLANCGSTDHHLFDGSAGVNGQATASAQVECGSGQVQVGKTVFVNTTYDYRRGKVTAIFADGSATVNQVDLDAPLDANASPQTYGKNDLIPEVDTCKGFSEGATVIVSDGQSYHYHDSGTIQFLFNDHTAVVWL